MAFPALAAWGHKHLLANGRDGVEPVVGLHSWERKQHPPHFKAFHAKAVEKGLLLDVIETGFP
jgi:hypothetical protein